MMERAPVPLVEGGSSLDEPALHPRPLLSVELPDLIPNLLREHSGPPLLSVSAHPRLAPLVVATNAMTPRSH